MSQQNVNQLHQQASDRARSRLSALRMSWMSKRLPRFTDGQRRTLAADPRRMDELINDLGADAVATLMGDTPSTQGAQDA